jgi:NADP-dependent 3-hydroxy acid dehydrogenase YdfG
VVTGASRGIGAAVTRALAMSHDVVLIGRDEQALSALADEAGSRWLAVELTDVEAVVAAVADLHEVAVLVHSAGVVHLGAVASTDAEVWRTTLDVNVVAVAALTRALLPALRAAGGHVVCINSGAGQTAVAEWSSYAASKFALRAFADSLRAEEPALRVTSIYPGRTATGMQRRVREAEGAGYSEGDYLRPESVAGAVAYVVNAPADAHVVELVIRPRPH